MGLSELKGLTLKELKTRARGIGVSIETVDDADGTDDPKDAVIKLILAKEVERIWVEKERLAEAERRRLVAKVIVRWERLAAGAHDTESERFAAELEQWLINSKAKKK